MPTNPFTFGGMITDPDQFIGRVAERRQIIDRLNGGQPQGSAVVGPRRIGKSSLLYYLTSPRSEKAPRPAKKMHLIYLDAQAGACETPARFRLTLMRRLLAGCAFDRRTTAGKDLDALRHTLATARDCPWDEARNALTILSTHPVICLDEFESLLTDAFDDRFFNALRSWANAGLLSWVTASAQPLESLADLHGRTSPFFNLLATIALGDFTEPEANQLLDRAETTAHAFTPRERRLIRRLAGRHPYHLQIVAGQAWGQKAAGEKVSKSELRRFLCRQPNPPPICEPRSWLLELRRLAGPLTIVSLLIALLLVSWFFAPGVQAWGEWAENQIGVIWNSLGQFGDGLGGLVAVIIILIVLGGGLLKRKRLAEIGRDLWQKIS